MKIKRKALLQLLKNCATAAHYTYAATSTVTETEKASQIKWEHSWPTKYSTSFHLGALQKEKDPSPKSASSLINKEAFKWN